MLSSIEQEPEGWPELYWAWNAHVASSKGHDKLYIAMTFMQDMLPSLKASPIKTSQKTYAQLFELLSSQEHDNWRYLGLNTEDHVPPYIVMLGEIAYLSGAQKSTTGKKIKEQWRDQLGLYFANIEPTVSISKTSLRTVRGLLQADLSKAFKLHACKACQSHHIWFHREIVLQLRALLTTKDEKVFRFFSQAEGPFWDPDISKQLVRLYLPESYSMLEMMLSVEDWVYGSIIQETLDRMAAAKQEARRHGTQEVPFDFDSSV